MLAAFGSETALAPMPVPKTSPYLHNSSVLRKNDVGLSGQLFVMKPVSVPYMMQRSSDSNLGRSIYRPYAAHNLGALLR